MIFIFLRNVAATIIPSLTLPVTIVGTFAVMYLLNYSLDNLSLMALTLSVGFIVDNTIVMLENIVRHMEMGKTPMQAAFDGSKEVGLHDRRDDGVAGRGVHSRAVHGRHRRTPAERVRGDDRRGDHRLGFVSISLTPMLCSRFLKATHGQQHGGFYNLTERMFDGWLRAYDWSLRVSLRFRALTMVASFALIAGTVYLFMIIPKGFLPTEDQGRFQIAVEGFKASASTSWFVTSSK